jgi:hypothetical protein
VLPLIDTAAIAGALGENADFVTQLIPLLDPALAAITNEALEGNPELVKALLANLDGAGIASALAQAPSFLRGLVRNISTDLVAAAIRGSDDNPDLLINILNTEGLAPSVADALDLSGTFMPTLLAMLPPSVAQAAAQGMNANPAMLDAVLGTADPQVLAGVLNSGAADALIAGLIPLLDNGIAQAVALGVNADAAQPVAQSMIKSLIINSDAQVIADALNNNADFVVGLLGDLNAAVAGAIADGMNANPGMARNVSRYLDGNTGTRIAEALSANPDIIEPLVSNLNPQVGLAIAEGLNDNTSDFNQQLMANLSNAVAQEVAAGLNNNTQLVTTLLANLDGDTGEEVALGLNENTVLGNDFLETMVGATTPDTAQAMANAMNTPPYNMDTFLSVLIQNLDAATAVDVAQGINANIAADPTDNLVTNILSNLNGQQAAQQLNNNEAFLTTLVANLDGAALANALNRALDPADPVTGGGGQAFMSDLLSNLNGDILVNAMNSNPLLTEQLMDQGGVNGLGSTIGWALVNADVGRSGGFLSDLIGTLDWQTMVNALSESMAIHDPNAPVPNHNLMECLWLKAWNVLGVWGGVPLRAWINFIGFEESNSPH